MSEGVTEDRSPQLPEAKAEALSPSQESLPAKLGAELIIRFYRLLKAAAFYDRNNIHIKRLSLDFHETLAAFLQAEGHLSLKFIRDRFFFNNILMPMKADQYSILKTFSQEMAKKWIGEVEFAADAGEEALKDFVFLLAALEEKNESNYLFINKQLEARKITHIVVGKPEFSFQQEELSDSDDHKRQARKTYFRSIHLVREVVEGVKQQKMVNIRKAKHLMENTVNSIMQDESVMLGLANIKNYDEYTFNHCVNVAIYAIAIGQRIGFSKKLRSQLGMAGLFHDIGKTRIPLEILNKTEKLTPEDWAVIRRHPVFGAETIMRIKDWGDLSARMIYGAFDHHLKFDLSGYPRLSRKRNLSLFGKIIALADFYDALVRPRVYRKFPFVSEKILGFMLENAGKEFDPILVKVFINMVGIFPLGTLVLLNTNEMGIVVKTQEDPDFGDRPVLCLLSYSEGEYRKGKEIDLKETDETTGAFKRSIVKTLDPNEYNLNIAEFLIG
jgi:HD-GYP domain-containing protein (c-di-GMP phosphodiesterase class II)